MGTYALVPPGGLLVSSRSPGFIAKLDFEKFSQILLVSCGAAEIAFAAVVGDGLVQHSCGIFW